MTTVNEETLQRKLLTIKEMCLDYIRDLRAGKPLEEDEAEYLIEMILREAND